MAHAASRPGWCAKGSAQGDAFVIDSPLASHEVKVLGDGQFAVTMGVPAFEPANVPLMGFAHPREEYLPPLQGESVRFAAVSMGNPHAVIEVGLIDAARLNAWVRCCSSTRRFRAR